MPPLIATTSFETEVRSVKIASWFDLHSRPAFRVWFQSLFRHFAVKLDDLTPTLNSLLTEFGRARGLEFREILCILRLAVIQQALRTVITSFTSKFHTTTGTNVCIIVPDAAGCFASVTLKEMQAPQPDGAGTSA